MSRQGATQQERPGSSLPKRGWQPPRTGSGLPRGCEREFGDAIGSRSGQVGRDEAAELRVDVEPRAVDVKTLAAAPENADQGSLVLATIEEDRRAAVPARANAGNPVLAQHRDVGVEDV